jgi:uncharacterized protein DUF4136
VDFDHGRDFSSYKTYRWAEFQDAQSPYVQFPLQLMRERIAFFVQDALAARQLTRVERGEDLLVDYAVKIRAEPQFVAFTDAAGRSCMLWLGLGAAGVVDYRKRPINPSIQVGQETA